MTATFTYDGDDLERVRRESLDINLVAELGTVGQSTLTYNDTAGTQEIIGDKDFEANEDDCATALLVRGFIADRGHYRGAESMGMGREIDIAVDDLNSILRFRMIDGADGKRPAETVSARMAWIMGSSYVSGLFADNGRIDSSTRQMDKSDYHYQYPGDVITDCALAARGFNFHVQDYGADPELIFRNDNTSTADSISLKISNVLADVDGATVFAPYKDARLTRSPALVWSKIAMAYSKGTVVRERPATASAFNGERGGNASNSNIKTATQAGAEANHQLIEHSTEEDVLECTILVPSDTVNLFPPGFRMQAKFSHLTTEGYGSYTWFRILEVGKKTLLKPAALYELRLKLSPQEAGSEGACGYDATPDGTFYPLGQGGTGPGDSHSQPSDGVVSYERPGIYYPVLPSPGAESMWHFPAYGAGGPGTIDYAGDCVQNQLQFIVVGSGTLTVQTETYGSTRPMAGSWGASPDAYAHSIGAFTSGDEVVFDVTGECVTIIRLYDGPGSPCGGKWGWSVATWVGA